jgi:hypothetical protein
VDQNNKQQLNLASNPNPVLPLANSTSKFGQLGRREILKATKNSLKLRTQNNFELNFEFSALK